MEERGEKKIWEYWGKGDLLGGGKEEREREIGFGGEKQNIGLWRERSKGRRMPPSTSFLWVPNSDILIPEIYIV